MGEPTDLVTGIIDNGFTGAFTVSSSGVLAYETDSEDLSQMTWFDRAGAPSHRMVNG